MVTKQYETDARIAYFGYGSLVNLASLRTPYITAHPASLTGWQRVWLERSRVHGSFAPVDNLAFLSVERSEGARIDGMVIEDHASSLPELDRREALYDRQDVEPSHLHASHGDLPPYKRMFLYVAQTGLAETEPPPNILRSYLDVVAQGYLTHFGQAGLERFRVSTRNFHFPILEDRHEPIYPRHVTLTEPERVVIDDLFPPVSA